MKRNQIPRILVFATGSKQPLQGGSGFRHLAWDTRSGRLHARVCGVVTPLCSSVETIAGRLEIECFPWADVARPEALYRHIVEQSHPDLIVLCGWLKLVQVSDWQNPPILNIHPAPLPEFGGKGMYGLHVHGAVLKSGRSTTHLTVHLVNEKYDAGDEIFRSPDIPIFPDDTAKILQERVKQFEHYYYGQVINAFLKGRTNLTPADFEPFPLVP